MEIALETSGIVEVVSCDGRLSLAEMWNQEIDANTIAGYYNNQHGI